MSKFDKKNIMFRYFAIALVLTLLGIAVMAKAFCIMTFEKDYWDKVADRKKRDNVEVPPTRGNILSCDGQLMSGTLPEYTLVMDFQPGKTKNTPMDTAAANKLNKLWNEKMDSICNGLHKIFPSKSAEEFKAHIKKGRERKLKDGSKGARYWKLWPKRVNYNTYCEVRKLPIFNLSTGKGGFKGEEYISRRRPFGSLARRTVGEIGSEQIRINGKIVTKDTARYGLELAYDSLLRGENGLKHRRKVLNKFLDIPVKDPIDGADIVTTIDVGMQDLAERAVLDELKEINGEMGVAILMEVATGDVKAIVNMRKGEDGEYREYMNDAISYICEPGSVFKVASILVALDDGVVDTSFIIKTGAGVMPMYGSQMRDHNWRRGGYQDINVARSLEVSSNIGVSYVIDKFYHNNPEKYVGGLYRVGINEDLKLPISGYHPPKIRMPQKNKRGKYTNWSKTSLPWMSIGYETQIAPINTVTFYNAIANDGKMMRPRFVKQVVKDGVVIKEFPPEVIKEQIAKPEAIATMQTMLEHVVSQGLGKKAGSKLFKVAGKTGTAQVSQGKGGYKSGPMKYWLSFAGYFPADNPRYSCIVCLKKTGTPASGGGMSGKVFHYISEGVMAKDLKMDVRIASDSTSAYVPEVKNGNIAAANAILEKLDINTNKSWNTEYAISNPIWGSATTQKAKVEMSTTEIKKNVTPSVVGMGASDAIYLLENLGLKVEITGRGKVKSQSYKAGKAITEGAVCKLVLQ